MKIYKTHKKNVLMELPREISLLVKKWGFTLIEFLIVIVVIGILATIVIVLFNNASMKARDTKRLGDIRQIQTALESYYNRNAGYPSALTAGNSFVDANGEIYMAKIPKDPKLTESGHEYTYTANGANSYILTYTLASGANNIAAGNWEAVPGDIATPAGIKCLGATGGTITTSGIYTIHTFTASSTFSTNNDCLVSVLVIGGGGGGGQAGSGGGAGGYQYNASLSIPAQSFTVGVGPGGAAGVAAGPAGKGSNSFFYTITAEGGGNGVGQNYGISGGSGGSGGGSAIRNNTGLAGGTGTQGYNGGAGYNCGGTCWAGNSGGGGGAGQAGSAGGTSYTNCSLGSGKGGNGLANDISGASVIYASGGGGGEISGLYGTSAGDCSSYDGNAPKDGAGHAGTDGRGGGGGGGSFIGTTSLNGGKGGNGVVIIRYVTP